MIEQIFEFIGNHYILVGTFIFLAVAFLVNEGKQGGSSVSTTTLVNMINRDNAVVLDIRDTKDFGAGHIVDAINIPLSNLDNRATELQKYKESPIVIVCKMGQSASAAGKKLKALGYEQVHRLSGGMAEWSASNLPLVKS